MDREIFKYHSTDTHTEIIDESLNDLEKKELGIDNNLVAYVHEVGFVLPKNSESWDKDCFNVMISDNEDFDDADFLLFDISKLPTRFKSTYDKMLDSR